MKVCIVDTQSANFNSVIQALRRLGQEAEITRDLNKLKSAAKLIMPGVGTASAVMQGLNELQDYITQSSQPILGICLGMQVQAKDSYEVPLNSAKKSIKTLGIVEGSVKLLQTHGLALPHMGWNTIEHDGTHPLFKDIPSGSYFYFVHSYALELGDNTIAKCAYGQEFSAAIAKDNFLGVQFHPEKSGALGAKLLENFLKL